MELVLKILRWKGLSKLVDLMRPPPLDPAEQLYRLRAVERDIVLPVKFIYIVALFLSFFSKPWYGKTSIIRSLAQNSVEGFFVAYVVVNAVVALMLLSSHWFSRKTTQRTIFAVSFLDIVFLSGLTLQTGGFESSLYWLFLGLIVRNAASNPLARPQILLNLTVCAFYIAAGVADSFITQVDLANAEDSTRRAMAASLPESPTEPFLLRVFVLFLMTVCCYGLQVLFERERQANKEIQESSAREEKLQTAGRLAAEIAHQIKNPLTNINTAAFSIQRALADKRLPDAQQVGIIREEVERADRIITELMGYAQLAEGRIEKLNVITELNRALMAVFPPGTYSSIQVHTDYEEDLPALLMQRRHFAEIVVNILQNARDALGGLGEINVQAHSGPEQTVVITIQDDGPGIPADKLERVFEPYFTTKEKGTGLGLSIARHNAEMYGASVRVESAEGAGARFILIFPTRTFMKMRR